MRGASGEPHPPERVEEALRVRALVEEAPIFLWSCDLRLRLTFASAKMLDLLGLQPPVERIDWPGLIAPEDRPRFRQSLRESAERRTPRDVAQRLRRADGELFWVLNRVQGRFAADGELIGYVGSCFDATARIRWRENTLREREQLRQIVSDAPVAMALFDRDMRYLTHSRRWLEDRGITGQSLIGRSHYEVFPHTPDRWKEIHRRALAGERFSILEEVKQRADGSELHVSCSVHPWREASGEVGGLMIVTHTIDHLVEAREAALERSRLKSEFLANMSHEIRTPLNGVLGMSEILAETALDSSQREQLEVIRRSANALLKVVNEILDFSRIEAGKLEIEAIEFDLEDCVWQTIDLLAVAARGKGIELSCRIPNDVPRALVGDPGHLGQILTNVVGNAIKFTPSGEVDVEVTAQPIARDEVSLSFSIRDTGIGIAAQHASSILSPFVRADEARSRAAGGTGLGLAISARLAEAMGGKLSFVSELDRGSTFFVTLPFAVQREGRACEPHAASLRGARALVVESHATSREILREMLGGWGMRACCVADIEAALEELARSQPGRGAFRFVVAESGLAGVDRLIDVAQDGSAGPGPRMILLSPDGTTIAGASQRADERIARVTKPVRRARLLASMLGDSRPIRPGSSQEREATRKLRTRAPARVLLVEDNEVNRFLAVQLLRRFGHSVVVAENGRRAVRAAEQAPFDLILMDLQMPELDGFQATRLIRERESATGRRVPIVALTAHALAGYRERALAAGMDEYVSKPIEPGVLFRTIEDLLAGAADGAPRAERGADAIPASENGNLRAWVSDDESLLERIAALIRKEMPDQLARLREALARRDAQELARVAHGVKGCLAFHGEAVRTAERIEQHAHAGDLEGCEHACADLFSQIDVIRRDLERP